MARYRHRWRLPGVAIEGLIRYALARWHALTRYADDGLPKIDDSAAERGLRAVAFGRKNFLFVGSDVRGQRAAAMSSGPQKNARDESSVVG